MSVAQYEPPRKFVYRDNHSLYTRPLGRVKLKDVATNGGDDHPAPKKGVAFSMRRITMLATVVLVMVAMGLAMALPALAAPGKARAGERELKTTAPCIIGQGERASVIGGPPPPEEECAVYPDQGPGRGF